ncbi:hypothetical protein AAIH46_01750 [Rhizobium sp. 0TCS1.26]|uniref:hypothetical protein n=1 Tax=Rhizobium sp. 0TCS1.26 TaxID=3142623 RepID=UPI003D27D63D
MSEGDKDRPCAIVVSARQTGLVAVVPISHAYPEPGEEFRCIEVPPEVASAIGLDSAVNYVKLEINRFEWPGDHLRPLPHDPTRIDYGMLPKDFFDLVRKRLADLARARQLSEGKR